MVFNLHSFSCAYPNVAKPLMLDIGDKLTNKII